MSTEIYDRIRGAPSGNLIEYRSVRRWIDSLPKDFYKRTGKIRYSVYLPELRRFMEWLNEAVMDIGEDEEDRDIRDAFIEAGGRWTPDLLLKRRMDDLKSDDIMRRRWMEEQIQRYYKSALTRRLATAGSLKGQPISESTKQGALTAIASFFKNNYVPLTKLKVRKKAPRITQDYWFTTEDLRAMHDVAAPWEKAYITTEVSLGSRRGDTLWLIWNYIWPHIVDVEEIAVVGPLHLVTEKHSIEARPFLSPDATKDLKYLRAYQVERGRLGKYVFSNPRGEPYNENHINSRLKILFKRAGRNSRGLMVKTHGLRKMLFNELKNVGCPLDVRKLIVGKSVSEDIKTYIRDDELKKWFLKVLPRISISEPTPETSVQLNEKIEYLEGRIKDLEGRLKKAEAAVEMVDRMKQRFEEWQRRKKE